MDNAAQNLQQETQNTINLSQIRQKLEDPCYIEYWQSLSRHGIKMTKNPHYNMNEYFSFVQLEQDIKIGLKTYKVNFGLLQLNLYVFVVPLGDYCQQLAQNIHQLHTKNYLFLPIYKNLLKISLIRATIHKITNILIFSQKCETITGQNLYNKIDMFLDEAVQNAFIPSIYGQFQKTNGYIKYNHGQQGNNLSQKKKFACNHVFQYTRLTKLLSFLSNTLIANSLTFKLVRRPHSNQGISMQTYPIKIYISMCYFEYHRKIFLESDVLENILNYDNHVLRINHDRFNYISACNQYVSQDQLPCLEIQKSFSILSRILSNKLDSNDLQDSSFVKLIHNNKKLVTILLKIMHQRLDYKQYSILRENSLKISKIVVQNQTPKKTVQKNSKQQIFKKYLQSTRNHWKANHPQETQMQKRKSRSQSSKNRVIRELNQGNKKVNMNMKIISSQESQSNQQRLSDQMNHYNRLKEFSEEQVDADFPTHKKIKLNGQVMKNQASHVLGLQNQFLFRQKQVDQQTKNSHKKQPKKNKQIDKKLDKYLKREKCLFLSNLNSNFYHSVYLRIKQSRFLQIKDCLKQIPLIMLNISSLLISEDIETVVKVCKYCMGYLDLNFQAYFQHYGHKQYQQFTQSQNLLQNSLQAEIRAKKIFIQTLVYVMYYYLIPEPTQSYSLQQLIDRTTALSAVYGICIRFNLEKMVDIVEKLGKLCTKFQKDIQNWIADLVSIDSQTQFQICILQKIFVTVLILRESVESNNKSGICISNFEKNPLQIFHRLKPLQKKFQFFQAFDRPQRRAIHKNNQYEYEYILKDFFHSIIAVTELLYLQQIIIDFSLNEIHNQYLLQEIKFVNSQFSANLYDVQFFQQIINRMLHFMFLEKINVANYLKLCRNCQLGFAMFKLLMSRRIDGLTFVTQSMKKIQKINLVKFYMDNYVVRKSSLPKTSTLIIDTSSEGLQPVSSKRIIFYMQRMLQLFQQPLCYLYEICSLSSYLELKYDKSQQFFQKTLDSINQSAPIQNISFQLIKIISFISFNYPKYYQYRHQIQQILLRYLDQKQKINKLSYFKIMYYMFTYRKKFKIIKEFVGYMIQYFNLLIQALQQLMPSTQQALSYRALSRKQLLSTQKINSSYLKIQYQQVDLDHSVGQQQITLRYKLKKNNKIRLSLFNNYLYFQKVYKYLTCLNLYLLTIIIENKMEQPPCFLRYYNLIRKIDLKFCKQQLLKLKIDYKQYLPNFKRQLSVELPQMLLEANLNLKRYFQTDKPHYLYLLYKCIEQIRKNKNNQWIGLLQQVFQYKKGLYESQLIQLYFGPSLSYLPPDYYTLLQQKIRDNRIFVFLGIEYLLKVKNEDQKYNQYYEILKLCCSLLLKLQKYIKYFKMKLVSNKLHYVCAKILKYINISKSKYHYFQYHRSLRNLFKLPKVNVYHQIHKISEDFGGSAHGYNTSSLKKTLLKSICTKCNSSISRDIQPKRIALYLKTKILKVDTIHGSATDISL